MPQLSEFILLRDVPRVLEQVVAVHPATVYRWASQGIAGELLRCVSVGGRRATTIDWLDDFFQRVDEARVKAQRRPMSRTRDRVEEVESTHVADTLKRFGID